MQIENFSVQPLRQFKYIQPLELAYTQKNVQKRWEAVKQHDSVAVLLYHEQKEAFLLVKQFRPPVYMMDSSKTHTYELCAGILDKELSLKQIVSEEIDEECGYKVAPSRIEKITSFYTNVGVSGAKQHLFYATIRQEQKIHSGGGIAHEYIELEYLPLAQAKEFVYDETKAKTPGLMFAFYWFFEQAERRFS
ncbi:MAG: NUDIX domain-containing protein [Campylobacterota bacterium]